MHRNRLAAWALVAGTVSLVSEVAAQADAPRTTGLLVDDVAQIVGDEQWVLVDARPTDAYNGWRLRGIKRGGHLPGAVDFPASWLDSSHEDRAQFLSTALRVKGIEPHRRILIYGDDRRERTRVAEYLRTNGCRHLYDFDLTDWANDPARPLERYENYHLLVPASIVKLLLDGQLPETFEHAQGVKFVEASWGGEGASYAKGHVPRSFHVNTDHFEPPPKWKLGSPEVLARFAQKYGFASNDTVVISGEDPTACYRLAIVLRYMGVEDVRVLNGGFAAWKAARYQVETESSLPPNTESFGARIPQRPRLIDETPQVVARLRSPSEFVLVDTRSWAEFTGKISGYKYHFRKGRIPGSIYGQGEFEGANSLEPYRNIDNTMRNADEILTLWRKSKIDPKKHLSFMCGGGWRAAEVLTFAQVMGLSNTSLYSDGWIGWSNDPRNPIEAGPIGERRDSQ